MKRLSISTVFVLLTLLPIFGQKEIYFSSTPKDSIKVESMHGIETRISLLPDGFSVGSFPSHFNSSIYLGYFNEKQVANYWTLNTTIGLHNIAFKQFILQKDTTLGYYYSSNSEYKYAYMLVLEAGIEPRWYFGYRDRYQSGKAKLNSGWYLSFPLLIQTTLLQSPNAQTNNSWIPNALMGSLIFTPSMGLRQAISNRMFLEGSVGFGGILFFGTNSWDHKFNILSPFMYPQIKIKAAYTFK